MVVFAAVIISMLVFVPFIVLFVVFEDEKEPD